MFGFKHLGRFNCQIQFKLISMIFRRIYPFIMGTIISTIFWCSEHHFPVSLPNPIKVKPNHWKHSAANSVLDINQIKVEVFQWRAAADSKDAIQVKLVNPTWEFAGWNNEEIVLPKIVEISNPLKYRGTPTVYIRITPWRIIDNRVEVLTEGEIQISVEPVNFPINFNHPYLLNGEGESIKRTYSEGTEYLIITPERFESAAQSLADMHMNEVGLDYRLNTEVVLSEFISPNTSGTEIREYILNQIEENSSLEYLLLFGDEIDIPPIFYNNDYPSDDFYTTVSDSMFTSDPQLFSGRIPIKTEEEALQVVEKILEYTLYPAPGIWKSKVALVADDMYRSCSYSSGESSHTEYSDIIYDSLKTLLPISPFYGVHYGLQPTSSGCAYPDLTADFIRTINNGVGLINYIGHGDPETWAGEKLISKSRDLPLIHPQDHKLAIWVAGTCSFGNYYGENSFMESLLFKEEGAIAVVATTDVIGYDDNWTYLENLFGLSNEYGIEDYVNGDIDYRLGKLVARAKNGDRKFHTFGDPALRLPFPKVSNTIITGSPNPISLIQEQTVSVGGSGKYSTLLVRGNEREIPFGSDNLLYSMPGVTYAQMNSDSNQICFRIPLDAGSCDSCTAVIQIYQDSSGSNGNIQYISDIEIAGSDLSFQDDNGPEIQIYQDGKLIVEGSAIFPYIGLDITLNDRSGINLMETIGHGIRYAFDENDLTLISSEEFVYETCSEGMVQVPVNLGNTHGRHHFYLEAWDGVNNQNTIDLDLEILGTPSVSQLLLSKVYPFPNPFSASTHFTMFISDTPANITITVYSLMGSKVRKLEYEAKTQESFISIPWDGRDESGSRIANGAYFYHVKAEKEGKVVFENIYKLAKVE